jgi:hypothetical protein
MLDLAKGFEAGVLRAKGFFKPDDRLLDERPFQLKPTGAGAGLTSGFVYRLRGDRLARQWWPLEPVLFGLAIIQPSPLAVGTRR